MERVALTDAKHRILRRVKIGGEVTAGTLAEGLGLTDVAVRQHLATMERAGLVRQRTKSPEGRGRPAILWAVTELANKEFPERHAELSLGLIEAARKAVGDDGLQQIIDVRAKKQVEEYVKLMPAESAPLRRRLEALAKRRTAEGYMAEVVREGKGSYLLIEHHCPICEAARSCTGLCSAELRVFQQVLGPKARVERIRHVIEGSDRCVYRVTSMS